MSFGKDVHEEIKTINRDGNFKAHYLAPNSGESTEILSSSESSITIATSGKLASGGFSHGVEIIDTNRLDRIAILKIKQS